jgi:hypothetical protein
VILRRRISAASLGVPRRTWCPVRPCPLLTLLPCGSHRLRLIRLSPRMASLPVAAVLGALPGPPRCRSGAGRARWQRLTAQFWLFPLELHPRGLPLRLEFLNIWYPFHAMVSLATGRSSATLPLRPWSLCQPPRLVLVLCPPRRSRLDKPDTRRRAASAGADAVNRHHVVDLNFLRAGPAHLFVGRRSFLGHCRADDRDIITLRQQASS